MAADQSKRIAMFTYSRRLRNKTDRRLHVYALELVVMLLIPLAVALAALQQWRAGDFRAASGLSPAKEIL